MTGFFCWVFEQENDLGFMAGLPPPWGGGGGLALAGRVLLL